MRYSMHKLALRYSMHKLALISAVQVASVDNIPLIRMRILPVCLGVGIFAVLVSYVSQSVVSVQKEKRPDFSSKVFLLFVVEIRCSS